MRVRVFTVQVFRERPPIVCLAFNPATASSLAVASADLVLRTLRLPVSKHRLRRADAGGSGGNGRSGGGGSECSGLALVGHRSRLHSVAWSHDGSMLVSASADRTAMVRVYGERGRRNGLVAVNGRLVHCRPLLECRLECRHDARNAASALRGVVASTTCTAHPTINIPPWRLPALVTLPLTRQPIKGVVARKRWRRRQQQQRSLARARPCPPAPAALRPRRQHRRRRRRVLRQCRRGPAARRRRRRRRQPVERGRSEARGLLLHGPRRSNGNL